MEVNYKFPENTAVHCPTIEDLELVLKTMSKLGIWDAKKWHTHKSSTAVNLANLTYAEGQFYVMDGYNLISMEEFKQEIQRQSEEEVNPEPDTFRLGDRVFDVQFGWGKVTLIEGDDTYPIEVLFASDVQSYAKDGTYNIKHKLKTLSFTEYDLINGGFSQKRPMPEIEVDTLIYVKSDQSNEWLMRYFSHFQEDGKVCTFGGQLKSTDSEAIRSVWSQYSLTNPLEK